MLVEFFRISRNNSQIRLEALSRWFWRTSLTRQYSGATTGQITRYLEEIRAFANQETDELKLVEPNLNLDDVLMDVFNSRNASSTAFMLLLKSKFPQNSVQGFSLSEIENVEKDKRLFGCLAPSISKISKTNISMVFGAIKKTKKGLLPYSKDCDYENHFFDEPSFEMLVKGDFENAITRRAQIIKKYVLALTTTQV